MPHILYPSLFTTTKMATHMCMFMTLWCVPSNTPRTCCCMYFECLYPFCLQFKNTATVGPEILLTTTGILFSSLCLYLPPPFHSKPYQSVLVLFEAGSNLSIYLSGVIHLLEKGYILLQIKFFYLASITLSVIKSYYILTSIQYMF